MSNEPADQQGNVQQDQIAHPESQAQWSLVAEGITLRARITALETEIAVLKGGNDFLARQHDLVKDDWRRACEQRDALETENAALREAAKEIMPLVWFGVAAVSKDGGDFAELAAHAERLNALLNKEAK